MKTITTQLHPNSFYHIYNRGVNGNPIYFEEKNYLFFLQQYNLYVTPYFQTFAYCLLGNHFHLLVKTKTEEEVYRLITTAKEKPLHWYFSNSISSFLKSYTRAMNKVYDRSGPLFENRFKRIKVDTEAYFSQLIAYIHRNPENHGLVNDFKVYRHSSYWSHLLDKPTKLERDEVLEWFGGKQPYIDFHKNQVDTKKIKALLLE